MIVEKSFCEKVTISEIEIVQKWRWRDAFRTFDWKIFKLENLQATKF